jgi:4-cresol dehydrogenase (hydroxylating)
LVPRKDDLIPLVDIQNYLESGRVTNGWPAFGSPLLGGTRRSPTQAEASAPPPRDPELVALVTKDDGALGPELQAYADQKEIAYWSCNLPFYGPPKVVTAQWEYAKERFSSIAGAKFEEGELVQFPLTPEQRERVSKPQFGIPNLSNFSQSARSKVGENVHPPNGHVWFAPLIPRTGEGIFEMNKVFGQFGRETGLFAFRPSVFKMPACYFARAFMCLFAFRLSATDIESNRKMRAAYRAAVKLAGEHGWGEYRSAPTFYDDAMRVYSYNNQALLHLHETIKDAVDPDGILSAGRYGIWPKHLRHENEGKVA